MKRIVSLIMIVAMLFCLGMCVKAEENITVLMDGNKLEFDVQPQLINMRTMVPLRKIFETFNMNVSYEESTEVITAEGNRNKIVLQVGSNKMTINGAEITIDSPAVEINGRTLVPVRAIAESLGVKVDWDDPSRTVMISSYKDGYTMPESYSDGAVLLSWLEDKSSSTYYSGWVLFDNGFVRKCEISADSLRYLDRYVYVKSMSEDVFTASSLTRINGPVVGTVDKENRKIGDYKLSDNCVILDVTNIKSEEFIPKVKEIKLEEMNSSRLNATDVLCVKVNENKEVTMLILNNVTKKNYSFGYLENIRLINTETGEYAPYVRESLTDNQAKKEQLIYTINEDGVKINPFVPMYADGRTTSLINYKYDHDTPVMYISLNNRIFAINKLQGVVNGGTVKEIGKNKLVVGSVNYTTDFCTKFYKQNKDGTLAYISNENIESLDVSSISSAVLYKDSESNAENTLRFVIFKLK